MWRRSRRALLAPHSRAPSSVVALQPEVLLCLHPRKDARPALLITLLPLPTSREPGPAHPWEASPGRPGCVS